MAADGIIGSVTASEYGKPAPGVAEAKKLLVFRALFRNNAEVAEPETLARATRQTTSPSLPFRAPLHPSSARRLRITAPHSVANRFEAHSLFGRWFRFLFIGEYSLICHRHRREMNGHDEDRPDRTCQRPQH